MGEVFFLWVADYRFLFDFKLAEKYFMGLLLVEKGCQFLFLLAEKFSYGLLLVEDYQLLFDFKLAEKELMLCCFI